MTNKYQEALNYFKNEYNICDFKEDSERVATLQELIDDYDYMETDVELAKQEIELLNKALDKACSKLSEFTENANMPELNVHSVVYSKEAWKEWLLNDK